MPTRPVMRLTSVCFLAASRSLSSAPSAVDQLSVVKTRVRFENQYSTAPFTMWRVALSFEPSPSLCSPSKYM